jgi:hypothetical protein
MDINVIAIYVNHPHLIIDHLIYYLHIISWHIW